MNLTTCLTHPSERDRHRAEANDHARPGLPFIAIFLLVLASQCASLRAFPFLEPVQPPRAVQVIAHRGASRQAPENTRPALDHCIEDGFEWAEVDVRRTSDGHHVLAHGDRLTLADGESPPVSQLSLDELKRLDLGSSFAARFKGEPILTLPECLALARGRLNLYLDCKAVDPERLAREILEAGMERQVVLYDSLANLLRMDQAAQGRLALMAKWHPPEPIESWARSHHLAAVEIDADEITPSVVTAFHQGGLKVQSKVLGDWDRPELWERSIAAGADWLQTDLPEEVLAHAFWRQQHPRPALFSLHRGAGRYAPENTLPAFEKSLRLGADYVEFDVRATSDRHFYLLHNSTLDGQTSGHGPIASTPSAVVQTLSAGLKFGRPYADLRLPTLDQFLSAMEGRVDLYFDAKAIPPEALAAAVERHRMAERTVVYQSLPYLLRLRQINPKIRALPPLGDPAELDKIATRLHPYAVDARWEILSKDLIDRCHALGIRVFSDALGDHEKIADYLQAIDWGLDLIQTDHPLRLLRAFELRAP